MLGVFSNPYQPTKTFGQGCNNVWSLLTQMFGEIIPNLREQMFQVGWE